MSESQQGNETPRNSIDTLETHASTVPTDSDMTLISNKKIVNRWITIVAVVGIAILVVVTATVMYFVMSKPARIDPLASATSFSSAKDLVSKIKPDAEGLQLQAVTLSGIGGMTEDGFMAYSAPAYQVGDAKFDTLPAESSGAGYVSDATTADANYKKITQFFTNNKFHAISKDNGLGSISNLDIVTITQYAVYESQNIVCNVLNANASATKLKNSVVNFACADKESYSKMSTALQPFYDAYNDGNDQPAKGLVFGDPNGAKGSDGYENAIIYQEDAEQRENDTDSAHFNGLYYKAPGDSKWTYFTGVRGILQCDEYKTDVIKKAFKGVACYDFATQKDTVVQ